MGKLKHTPTSLGLRKTLVHRAKWRGIGSFQVGWDWVDLVWPFCVDVGVVDQVAAFWVSGYVGLLVFEVFFIADAVFVVAGVPDFAFELFADGEGKTALDELDAAGGTLVHGWCDENVDVVGHDGEGVEGEAALVAVAEEGRHHELCVCSALEEAVALVSENRNGIGALRLTDGGHERRAYPRETQA
jgi:hypothetical protein